MRGAVEYNISSKYVEFGYDPGELLEMMHLQTDKKTEMLKPI